MADQVFLPTTIPLEQVKRKKCSICPAVFLIVSIFCNLGLAGYCAFLGLQMARAPNPRPPPADQSRSTDSVGPSDVCVLCQSLGLRGDSKALSSSGLHVVRGDVEEEDLCCQQNATSLQLLLQLMDILNRTAPSSALIDENGMMPKPNPSAHLFLQQRHGNYAAPLDWTDRIGGGVAHQTGNVIKLKSGRLYIPEDGLYFVYSALTFKVRDHLPRPADEVHSLYRENETDLLLTRKTTLPVNAETFASSFLSGILRLRSGDQIGVWTSNVSFVYDFWSTSYFGLLKLGE